MNKPQTHPGYTKLKPEIGLYPPPIRKRKQTLVPKMRTYMLLKTYLSGCLHGGMLSPLMWSIIVANLADNQAAIKAHRSHQVNCKLICKCFDELNTIGPHNKVCIHLDSSHIGLEDNETENELARKEAKHRYKPQKPFVRTVFVKGYKR